jgi:transcriptional regulator with XRE-family HTH domain
MPGKPKRIIPTVTGLGGEVGQVERRLGGFVGKAIRDGRRSLGLTQRALATRAGVSQTAVSRAERGVVEYVSILETARILDALDVRLDVAVHHPYRIGGPAARDAVHLRLMSYAARRLGRCGFEVAREVPVGTGRVLGWMDLLGWRPNDRALLVVEVKGDLTDVGALERQVAWYEREAWNAARSMGWRPSRIVVAALALASRHNDAAVRAHSDALGRRFPGRPSRLAAIVAGEGPLPGERILAFVDPHRRQRTWLLPTPLSGGRPVLPYASADDLRSVPVRADCRRARTCGHRAPILAATSPALSQR